MKYLPYILVTGLFLGLLHSERVSNKKKRMNLVEYSFETGCFEEAFKACSKFNTILKRGDCLDDANENCPLLGHKFRKALEDYKP